jgi:hypothetical protein
MPENEDELEQDNEDFGEDEDGFPIKMPYEVWLEKYGMED